MSIVIAHTKPLAKKAQPIFVFVAMSEKIAWDQLELMGFVYNTNDFCFHGVMDDTATIIKLTPVVLAGGLMSTVDKFPDGVVDVVGDALDSVIFVKKSSTVDEPF